MGKISSPLRLRQKLFLALFSLAAVFFLLEAGLRVAGYIYYSHRVKNRASHIKNENTIRILCVGDSFTFGVGASDGYSYPQQLEKLLNKNDSGHKFIVYNQGIPGENSSQMLNKLPKYLEKYMPHIVIIMAGADNKWNLYESNYFLFKKGAGALFYRMDASLSCLRSYKLCKILIGGLRNKSLGIQPKHKYQDNNQAAAQAHSLSAKEYIDKGALGFAIAEYKKALEINPMDSSSIIGLADVYQCKEENAKAEQILKKAIEADPNSIRAYDTLWKLYWRTKRDKLALEVISQQLKIDPSNETLKRISRVGLPSLDDERIFKKLLEYDLENMIKLIKTRGAKVILQNYPHQDKGIFYQQTRKMLADKWNIIYVDNEEYFRGLKNNNHNYRYGDYFVEDGHCNNAGYQLIAQNAYKALQPEIKELLQ
ncbi:MAG: GDSL-type esterase/lipase family protein [Candidatus Omnitrophica bacterium]|nr:GDSL-type esterase/lipase family protein [Candidatus Omnitrophota bacterium]